MTLYAREIGPHDKPTLVLIHGGGLAGWSWQPQIERLTDFHLLVPDLPEHGGSMEEKPLTIAGAAERVAELIREKAHGGRAHVVGISLGGQTVVQLLAQAPDVVDHAMASGTLVRGFPGLWMIRPMLWLSMPFIAQPWMIRANMRNFGAPEEFYEPFRQDMQHTTLDALAHIYEENFRFHLPAGLDRVTAPVLVVAGQKELKAIHDSARDLVKAIPGAKGYVVAGGMHTWNFQFPDLFAQTVRAWTQDQPLPAGLVPLIP